MKIFAILKLYSRLRCFIILWRKWGKYNFKIYDFSSFTYICWTGGENSCVATENLTQGLVFHLPSLLIIQNICHIHQHKTSAINIASLKHRKQENNSSQSNGFILQRLLLVWTLQASHNKKTIENARSNFTIWRCYSRRSLNLIRINTLDSVWFAFAVDKFNSTLIAAM